MATYQYSVPLTSNRSVTVHFQGNIDRATLVVGGNVIDRVDVGDETSGQLNFLNGSPIHLGLTTYHKCVVEIQSISSIPPIITEVAAANDLTWADIAGDMYTENVTLARPVGIRTNNVLVYGSGMLSLKYWC